MAKTKRPKIVLAYSGGLDTSVIIPWLGETYGYDVVAFIADLGQEEDLRAIRAKALKTGAVKAIVRDLRREFAEQYVLPALQAGAQYEGKYLMATALGRPLIAKHLCEIAAAEGAVAVAHGSTGKGNDQVRFDVSVMALAPHLKIVAPVREWEFTSRDQEIEYAAARGIPVPVTKKKPYSLDKNLWGISIECGVLEDPWVAPPEDIYSLTRLPRKAPARAEEVVIGFERGVPVALNGKRRDLVPLIVELNRVGGRHGVGVTDLVENRLVGIKSREIYEAPGGTILHAAHRELEALVLDREMLHTKQTLVTRYSEMVYYGWWFSPLREALDAFVAVSQRNVSGEVRLSLYKGSCRPLARRSPFSLYDRNLATYEASDTFDHKAGAAFTKLWGLPLKIQGRVAQRAAKK
ncbi:MAG TPA: argininosuccinate synthase [bacterium]